MARRNSVQVYGTNDLRSLARDLRQQADGADRRKQLVKELRQAAKPLSTAAKAGARALPSDGENARRGVDSLRRDIARSVTIKVATGGRHVGVRVFMNPKKIQSGRRALPRYIEAVPGWTRWRHPMFGNTDVWVTQPSHPFFTRATASGEQLARRAVQDVIQRMITDLENG